MQADGPMIMTASARRAVIYMTIGFWALCYGLSMLPNLALYGELPAYTFAMYAVGNLFGFPASAALFVLTQGMRHLRLAQRIVLVALAVVALSIVHAFIEKAVIDAFERAFAPSHYNPRAYRIGVVVEFLMYIWIYGMYAAGLASFLASLTVRDRERQLADAMAAAQAAQLAALRFQLNPHFLFNTLNAISSLIVSNRPEGADLMTTKLSEFLRASLATRADSLVALAEELDTIHAYLDIEGVRFGDRMSTEIDCPPDLIDALIPSLLLQPIVENAVKFAVAPTRGRVEVFVRARAVGPDIQITIEDRGGEGSREAPAGEGVGLRNVRDRLDIHYGPAGRIDTQVLADGFRATIRFPLHRAVAAAGAQRPRSAA